MGTNATTEPTARSPQQHSSAQQRHAQRSLYKRKVVLGPVKRFCVYIAGQLFQARETGDTSSSSSDSSLGSGSGSSSDDESDMRKKQQPKSSISSSRSQKRQEARGIRWESNPKNDGSTTNTSSSSRGREMERNQGDSRGGIGEHREYADTLGYYDVDLAETIEDEIHIRTLESGQAPSRRYRQNTDGTTITPINFQSADDDDDSDDHSIIKEVTSIETDFGRPGVACCYCAETVPQLQPCHSEKQRRAFEPSIIRKKNQNQNHKKWQMSSMLSDDDEKDNEKGDDTIVEKTSTGVYLEEIETTVEECEARFMAELESAQCEYYNLENSHWKKGFDFVRS